VKHNIVLRKFFVDQTASFMADRLTEPITHLLNQLQYV